MATLLGNETLGTIVKLKENGVPQEFYVAKHGYPTDGNGRTLLVRRYIYDTRQWHTSNVNAYASCALDSWFNNTYYNLLDADIKAQIAAVAIPYTPGNGNNSVSTLSRKVFALSVTELGRTASYANVEGSALPIASTLQIAYNSSGGAVVQWTRSPSTAAPTAPATCTLMALWATTTAPIPTAPGPAFTLPSSLSVSDDGQRNRKHRPSYQLQRRQCAGGQDRGLYAELFRFGRRRRCRDRYGKAGQRGTAHLCTCSWAKHNNSRRCCRPTSRQSSTATTRSPLRPPMAKRLRRLST